MAETSDTDIVFISKEEQPKLKAGRYTLTTSIADDVLVSDTGSDKKLFSRSIDFSVGAPRFSISQAELHSVWPPDGHNGDFSATLPQIMFQRPTVPWERKIKHPKAGAFPWMALLSVSESDFADGKVPTLKVRTVAELIAPKQDADGKEIIGPEITLPLEDDAAPGETADALCTTLDLDVGFFSSAAPALEDLKFLSHVRKVKSDKTGEKQAYAVVLANRFPASAPPESKDGVFTYVFLISLEGHLSRLRQAGENAPAGAPRDIRLAVLHSWSFRATKAIFFKDHMTNLQVKAIGEPNQQNAPSDAQDAIIADAKRRGFSAMDHHMRDGSNTVSWYRGPLIPYELTAPALPKMHVTADSALRYDPATGLFDISYAAAFQLGRLLALKDRHFSKSFVQWTTRYRNMHNRRPGEFRKFDDAPEPLVKAFLKARDPESQQGDAQPDRQNSDLPEDALMWLGKLSLLNGVPLNYIVPDEEMLGEGEMRVFDLDPNWMSALLSGACSLGRHRANNEFFDDYLAAAFNNYPKIGAGLKNEAQTNWPLGGFVLRSSVVGAWSSLSVNASCNGQERTPLRVERIGPDILFCLYNGQLDKLQIKQPQLHSHFGTDDLRKKASDQRVLEIASYAKSNANITDSASLAQNIIAPTFVATISIDQDTGRNAS